VSGVDRETFRQIFEDHWGEFEERHQGYGAQYYDEVGGKMRGCGKEEDGYSEYLCTR